MMFQFPTNGKAHGNINDLVKNLDEQDRKFQFPTNGKAHGNLNRNNIVSGIISVSIPYKRESTWELEETKAPRTVVQKFQFPTNGKAHGN